MQFDVMRYETFAKCLVFLGFTGLSVAIAWAYLNPATGYELSIYAETPASFWIFSSFALLVSILVMFSTSSSYVRALSVFLGGMAMTVILLLPIIRGYHYRGTGDALSHLGTARDMNAGLMSLTESRYPIVHPLGSVLHDTTGIELHHAMLLVVVVFVVCFFLFIPLVVRELTGDTWTTYIGFYSGLLILPINHLSPSMYIHPTSQALMYAPAFLFVFFLLYRKRRGRHSAMFLLVAPMFVLLHPQQAANLVFFFAVVAILQIGYDIRRGYWLDHRRKWVLPEVTFYTTVFWLWIRNLDTFWSTLENIYTIPFRETQAAESTATRSVSLTEVGGSMPEVFAKLFLVSLLYVVLTGLLMILVVRISIGHSGTRTAYDSIAPDGGTALDDETGRTLFLYIYAGLVAVTLVFLTFLVGGISDQYFRQLGMLMVFATILGSIAIGYGMQYVSRRQPDLVSRQSVAFVLVLCVALSVPIVFASPYFYYSSNHVTETQMSGYEMTFEHQNESILFDNIRQSTSRYGNAIQGREIPRDDYYLERRGGIPDHFANHSLRSYYNESMYVPVPKADRVRDPVLWKGFRFSHEDFEYLDSEPGINRVQTNGEYDLYLVEPVDEPTTATPIEQ